LRAEQACNNVPAYSTCEMVFELSDQEAARHPDPYTSVEMQVAFGSPKHHSVIAPAFVDGARKLVARVAPTEPGEWYYEVMSNVPEWNGKSGTFMAAASDAPGFIRPGNVHHWAYTERSAGGIERPHLWMGAMALELASLDDSGFRAMAEARAAEKFNHLRFLVLGGKSSNSASSGGWPGQADLARFERLDERIRYLNQKGIIADLVLAAEPGELVKLFPTPEARRRFVRYVVGRYGAFNITWEVVDQFEDYPDARVVIKEIGEALKETDSYDHPRSSGARVTSAPLLDDKWMSFSAQGTVDDVVGSVEHQLYPVPFVNLGGVFGSSGASGGTSGDAAAVRRRLWNATMDGQYVTYTGTGGDSPGARQFTVWFDVLSDTRHWELEPYFNVDGGRAVALEGVEYLVYMEKAVPLELQVEKHGYDALWINPMDGEVTRRKFSGDHFTGAPPDNSHDWVLHLVREGVVESMNKSFKFASRDILMQEIEQSPEKTPFEIEQPASAADVAAGKPVSYSAKIKRESRATRSVMWLWTGEVAADGQGYRVLATGPTGTFRLPPTLAKNYPAVVNLRLYAMNGYGKVYALDRVLQLTR
jgi:Domain of unknown function (DUF5060)/Protein of unknown function (DUF4038)